MTDTSLQEFVEIVRRNLTKNGFPISKVSFPLERMYEEADRRGFSFNKVRDLLRGEGIFSELTDDRVVFSTTTPEVHEPEVEPDLGGEQDIFQAAQEMLTRMSPEEQQRLMNMVSQMNPEVLEGMKKQWEAMSPEEKRRMMSQMKNNPMGSG